MWLAQWILRRRSTYTEKNLSLLPAKSTINLDSSLTHNDLFLRIPFGNQPVSGICYKSNRRVSRVSHKVAHISFVIFCLPSLPLTSIAASRTVICYQDFHLENIQFQNNFFRDFLTIFKCRSFGCFKQCLGIYW